VIPCQRDSARISAFNHCGRSTAEAPRLTKLLQPARMGAAISSILSATSSESPPTTRLCRRHGKCYVVIIAWGRLMGTGGSDVGASSGLPRRLHYGVQVSPIPLSAQIVTALTLVIATAPAQGQPARADLKLLLDQREEHNIGTVYVQAHRTPHKTVLGVIQNATTEPISPFGYKPIPPGGVGTILLDCNIPTLITVSRQSLFLNKEHQCDGTVHAYSIILIGRQPTDSPDVEHVITPPWIVLNARAAVGVSSHTELPPPGIRLGSVAALAIDYPAWLTALERHSALSRRHHARTEHMVRRVNTSPTPRTTSGCQWGDKNYGTCAPARGAIRNVIGQSTSHGLTTCQLGSDELCRHVRVILNGRPSANAYIVAPPTATLGEPFKLDVVVDPSKKESKAELQQQNKGAEVTEKQVKWTYTMSAHIEPGPSFKAVPQFEDEIQTVSEDTSTTWSWNMTALQSGADVQPIIVRLRAYVILPNRSLSKPLPVDVLREEIRVGVHWWQPVVEWTDRITPVKGLVGGGAVAIGGGILAWWRRRRAKGNPPATATS
jgi:hypothetical protein